jgi:hypothetical protein
MKGLLLIALLLPPPGDIRVADSGELRAALKRVRPGGRILLAPGEYEGGVWIEKLNGTKGSPIVIEAADPENPPLFKGRGSEAIHLADCNHLVLRSLRISGFPANGLNADDGGSFETPSVGLVFDRLVIENTGPTGNHDALKMSGLDGFRVRNCRFAGWGGSAIDMVGCHEGVVENCTFEGKKGYSQSSGVQMKGGCRKVLVGGCFFNRAGSRAINLGGSTGKAYFRPQGVDYEAADIEVAGNRFVGGMAPVAFVTSIRGHVHHNTFVHPEKWVLRILQEQPVESYRSCGEGVFENNLVLFDDRVRTFVNVGPHTRPKTFVFRRNAWFDTKGARRPVLPEKETNGVYGVDPKLDVPDGRESKPSSRDARLRAVGAHAWKAGVTSPSR